jgi:hypothetical protein
MLLLAFECSAWYNHKTWAPPGLTGALSTEKRWQMRYFAVAMRFFTQSKVLILLKKQTTPAVVPAVRRSKIGGFINGNRGDHH